MAFFFFFFSHLRGTYQQERFVETVFMETPSVVGRLPVRADSVRGEAETRDASIQYRIEESASPNSRIREANHRDCNTNAGLGGGGATFPRVFPAGFTSSGGRRFDDQLRLPAFLGFLDE